MVINQVVRKGQCPQRVRILTRLPVAVQAQISTCLKHGKGSTVVYLAHATITITQNLSGEIAIVIEPP